MIGQRLLNRIEAKKHLLDTLRPLPAAILSRLQDQFKVEWIYNSNAIEGSTITLQETRLVLETGLTIGGKSLREHFEVINHRDAIDYVMDLLHSPEPITPFVIRQIHKLVLSKIDDQSAGTYRNTQVRISGANFTPPESWLLPNLMQEWADWISSESLTLHPIELAALAHHRLVAIHPFVDGNGRTARLTMNLVLLRAGYPVTVIEKINRVQYYQALHQADLGKTHSLENFVARAVERSLNIYLEACQQVPAARDPAEVWISLREAALSTPYSQEYLSLLARTGRINAIKRGRVWYTTRQAMTEYRASLNSDKDSGSGDYP